MTREIFICSEYGGRMTDALGTFRLTATAFPSPQRLIASLSHDQSPHAVYLDDTRMDLAVLWETARHVRRDPNIVLIAVITSSGREAQEMMQRISDISGVCRKLERTATFVEEAAAFIAETLKAERKQTYAVPICVAGAKGGIGKTLLIAQIALAFQRRGARVLMVDGDLTNSGLIPHFHIPQSFIPYTSLQRESAGHARFTLDNLRKIVYSHECGVDFLLGSNDQNLAADLPLSDWQSMITSALQLPYDVVLIDTGPDVKRRPYVIDALSNHNGWAVVPAPPGAQERYGVATLLEILHAHRADLTSRCMVVLMEPERGVVASLKGLEPVLREQWPNITIVGTLPRDPYLVSMAMEYPDRFVSPLDIGPSRPFSMAVHAIADTIAGIANISLPLPKPKPPWWKQLGSRIAPKRFIQSPETLLSAHQ